MKKFKKVYVEITNICNRQCSFCSVGSKPKREMSLQEFEHVLKEIRSVTNYIYLHVKGEPLIHSQFEGILDLCDSYQMKVNITTNGTLLRKQLASLIKHACVRQINISLHSFENGMNQYINDILFSTDQLLEKTSIIVVFRFWALSNHQLTDVNRNIIDKIMKHYQLSDEIYQKILSEKNIRLGEKLYLNKAALFEWPTLHSTYVGTRGFCHALTRHIGILSDGTVIPCCLDSDGIISLGNIFEKHIEEILSSEKCRTFVKSLKDGKIIEPLCQRCSFRLRFSKGKNLEMAK